jgi:hypothetical protein
VHPLPLVPAPGVACGKHRSGAHPTLLIVDEAAKQIAAYDRAVGLMELLASAPDQG